MMKWIAIVAMLGATGCGAQKTGSSAERDTTAAVVPVAPAVPVTPAASTGATTSPDPDKKTATKSAAKAPAAGGERDSAVQPTFEIGPDGKLRRIKR